MALTLTHSAPSTEINPVYTPFYYRCTSTLSNQPDYKYVFDLFSIDLVTGVDSSRMGRFKLYPQSDGSGIYSPARVLESLVSYNYVFFGSGFSFNTQSTAKYKIKFGEEYTLQNVIFTAVTNEGGYTSYVFNTNPFIVGDSIKIEKYEKNINLNYDGLQTVVSFTGNSVTTDKAYGIVTVTESGECQSRLTIQTGITSTGITFNAGRQYFSGSTNFADTFYLEDNTKLFLTNLEGNIRIDTDDVFTLSFLQNNTISACTDALIFTYSGNSIPVGVYRVPCAATGYNHLSVKVGTKNLAESITTNLSTSNVEPIYSSIINKYVVTLVNGNDNISQSRTFIVEDKCGYNYARLAWLNDLGGWSFMNFNMKQREKLEFEKSFVNKLLPYNYSVGDFTELVTSTNVQQSLTLNSYDFLTDEEFEHLKTLFYSPFVLYIDSNNVTLPFIITSKEFLPKKRINDKSRQLKIEGRFAFNHNLQRN